MAKAKEGERIEQRSIGLLPSEWLEIAAIAHDAYESTSVVAASWIRAGLMAHKERLARAKDPANAQPGLFDAKPKKPAARKRKATTKKKA